MDINKTYHTLFILLISLIVFSAACSSTRWIVEEEKTIDKNDYKILDTNLFLSRTDNISPSQPLIKFKLKTANTTEYAERVRSSRYIQNYKPRLGYAIFGVTSASIIAYATLNDKLIDSPSKSEKWTLLGSSLALTGVSFINMKPTGEPTPTGESKLMRKSGKTIVSDTLNVDTIPDIKPQYEIIYKDNVIARRQNREFNEDLTLNINLANEINPGNLVYNQNDEFKLNVFFNDSTYNYTVPVTSIFEPYVVVNSDVTSLRSEPEINPNNVLTELAKGSSMHFVDKIDGWIKVLYGLSETWLAESDVEMIWQTSEFADEISIIAIPNVPFGTIDIEKNIPTLVSTNRNRHSLIVANESYTSEFEEKKYATRDGRLMAEYFNRTLGVPTSNINNHANLNDKNEINAAINDLNTEIGQLPAELILYMNGYARIDSSSSDIYFLATNSDSTNTEEVNLKDIFDTVSDMPLTKASIILDLDFINTNNDTDILENLSKRITRNIDDSIVIFSSNVNQNSLIYSTAKSGNKRHSIFTYYFAEALQNRLTNWGAIVNHLQRNVSYTSRNLFNKAQDIKIYGNQSVDLNY